MENLENRIINPERTRRFEEILSRNDYTNQEATQLLEEVANDHCTDMNVYYHLTIRNRIQNFNALRKIETIIERLTEQRDIAERKLIILNTRDPRLLSFVDELNTDPVFYTRYIDFYTRVLEDIIKYNIAFGNNNI
jgi:hypothetical protein